MAASKTKLIKGLDGVSLTWLWLTVLLTPALAIAGGLGFQIAGLLVGVSTFLVWLADRSGAEYLQSLWPIGLISFLVWAWLSSLWSTYDDSLFGGNAATLFILTLALLFVPLAFLRLSKRMKSTLSLAFIIIGLLGVALILFDSASGYALSMWVDPIAAGDDPIRRYSNAEMNLGRGQVSYTQLAWPIAGLMMMRFKHGIWLAAVFFLGLSVSAQLNNLSIVIPALALSAGFAGLAWWRPRLGIYLAFILGISSLIFAPVLGVMSGQIDPDTMRQIPLSWEHRVRMWAYSWELIQHAPLIGHGFDSARVFDALTFSAPDGRDITVMSMHPHNVGLQIWLETGLIGVGLMIFTLWALLRAALKTCQSSARAMTVAGLMSATTICGAVTIGIWQHWWWALIVLTVSLIILLPAAPHDEACL